MEKLYSFMSVIKTPLLILITLASLVYAWNSGHRSDRPAEQNTSGNNEEKAPGSIIAEGRLVTYPGAEVDVGTDLGGTIETMTVREKDQATKGAVLATIRASDLRAELSRAEARLREIDADIRLNDYNLTRAGNLLKTDVISRQQYDRAQRDMDASRARRSSMEADVRRIKAIIDKTRILAPISGSVVVRHAEPGETVNPGAKIVTLADLSRTRVEAEVDEFDVAGVKAGDRAVISAEGFKRTWEGRVEEVPDVVSHRQIKRQDPSKPVDARVLLVKVALKEATELKLGQRLEVRIFNSGAK
jgi:HlyD family secretion protein